MPGRMIKAGSLSFCQLKNRRAFMGAEFLQDRVKTHLCPRVPGAWAAKIARRRRPDPVTAAVSLERAIVPPNSWRKGAFRAAGTKLIALCFRHHRGNGEQKPFRNKPPKPRKATADSPITKFGP